MISGIYAYSAPSGGMYIGSSVNLDRRRCSHEWDLGRGLHHNVALQRAFDKYKDELKYSVMLICTSEDVLLYEQIYLDYFKPSYNAVLIVGLTTLGMKHTPEAREKMSQVHSGKTLTDAHRDLISGKMKGRTITPTHRSRISAALRGKKHSAQHTFRVSEALKGNKISVGRVLSAETRSKISASHLRRYAEVRVS